MIGSPIIIEVSYFKVRDTYQILQNYAKLQNSSRETLRSAPFALVAPKRF